MKLENFHSGHHLIGLLCCARHCQTQYNPYPALLSGSFSYSQKHQETLQVKSVMPHHVYFTQEYVNSCPKRFAPIPQGKVVQRAENTDPSTHITLLPCCGPIQPLSCPLCELVLALYKKSSPGLKGQECCKSHAACYERVATAYKKSTHFRLPCKDFSS